MKGWISIELSWSERPNFNWIVLKWTVEFQLNYHQYRWQVLSVNLPYFNAYLYIHLQTELSMKLQSNYKAKNDFISVQLPPNELQHMNSVTR
jgi:hypothetical protein